MLPTAFHWFPDYSEPPSLDHAEEGRLLDWLMRAWASLPRVVTARLEASDQRMAGAYLRAHQLKEHDISMRFTPGDQVLAK